MLDGVSGISDVTRAFVDNVRMYTRDHAELNRLIRGEESGDRQILWAVADALSRFNGRPPFLGNFSLSDLLRQGLSSLLTRMTVIALIESVGLLQTRNHLNYSNGGFNVGVNDKTPLLMNWLSYYRSTVDQDLLQAKVAMNIQQLLGSGKGGLSSELWYINGTYLSY